MYEYRCKVIRIIDGDTVDVDIDLGFGITINNQRIRLNGIDTPETRTSDKVEKKYGILAKDFLQKYLCEGQYATLKTIIDKDGDDLKGKFGRILGEFIVYDEKKDSYRTINDMLVEYGYAVRYHGQSKQQISEAHLKNRELLNNFFN